MINSKYLYVRCVNDKNTGGVLVKNGIYKVLVHIQKGKDYRGEIKKPGYIVILDQKTNDYKNLPDSIKGTMYPYVWDEDRFELYDLK